MIGESLIINILQYFFSSQEKQIILINKIVTLSFILISSIPSIWLYFKLKEILNFGENLAEKLILILFLIPIVNLTQTLLIFITKIEPIFMKYSIDSVNISNFLLRLLYSLGPMTLILLILISLTEFIEKIEGVYKKKNREFIKFYVLILVIVAILCFMLFLAILKYEILNLVFSLKETIRYFVLFILFLFLSLPFLTYWIKRKNKIKNKHRLWISLSLIILYLLSPLQYSEELKDIKIQKLNYSNNMCKIINNKNKYIMKIIIKNEPFNKTILTFNETSIIPAPCEKIHILVLTNIGSWKPMKIKG